MHLTSKSWVACCAYYLTFAIVSMMHSVMTLLSVPLLLPTLFGKRGIFTHSTYCGYFVPSQFHYHVVNPVCSWIACLISVYLKPVNYCHFIIQYFPRFAGKLQFCVWLKLSICTFTFLIQNISHISKYFLITFKVRSEVLVRRKSVPLKAQTHHILTRSQIVLP